jgi:BirA family transcriptional regulator, biotin operon repressor / biotin---[acetyl-CoA-carboxylase] ligase
MMAAATGRPKQGTAPRAGSALREATSVGAMFGWPAEAIWEAVAPSLDGFTVEILPEIDSTNSELMRRAAAGQLDPVLLVAGQQTAGRGRMGRVWSSDLTVEKPSIESASLTFSLGLPLSPASWSGLSLVVGLSVAQSLHPELRLKWPNDLWLRGRKLAGILIETASFDGVRFVVIGIGINIGPRQAQGLSTPPAWLQEVTPGIDAARALACVVPPLVAAIQLFEARGFQPFQPHFNALDALAGQAVTLSDGTLGQARGVDAGGALLVATTDGIKAITSSEVSVRPAPADPESDNAGAPC